MITDQEILSYFLKSNGHVNVQRLTNISQEYKEYLDNRYTDSQSLRETIKRIQYNIEVRRIANEIINKMQTILFLTYIQIRITN